MKKTIFFLAILLIFNACSSRKKKSDSTFMKGFYTYYNTLFNSKEALNTELTNRKKGYKENFYDQYIPILQYDTQPLGSNFDNQGAFSDDVPTLESTGRNFNTNAAPKKAGSTILEIAESKALKAIEKYSVEKKGVEKNKKIFDAYLLLAQSRLYQNKPLDALDAVNQIFSSMPKDKRMPLAKIYQAQAFAKLQDYYRSDELFREIKVDDLKKGYKKLYSIYYSEMLLDYGKKDEAIAELENAFKYNKNRELRSRIAFLRGQVLAQTGKNEEARESFVTAYKYANNFEFEVKSQIEIAKTFNGKADDYEGAKQYLERISKKGTYASRKNEFYYALGLMANKAGKNAEADSLFRLSLKEKISDPQIRGLDYFEIGQSYFKKSDYLAAGAFYDSALSVMTYEPSKVLLRDQTANLKNVSKNYYLIKKNDSILALAKMTDAEKTAYFAQYIEKLKAKEAAEELALKRAERSAGFDNGDYNANSLFASNDRGFQEFGETKGGFYFANMSTIAKGESSFKQIWGSRSLSDNWRSSARSASIEDLKNDAMGVASAPDPRRLEPSYYIEKIPSDATLLSQLKKDRDTASLGLGRMYSDYFSDNPLATKTLYALVDNQPEEDVKLQALYTIFAINYKDNAAAADRAKQIILSDYPYTSYAEFVKNPKNNNFLKSSDEVSELYTQAFGLYSEEKYEESKAIIESALAKYPNDALIPKFSLLNAFNIGKTAGKEIMILQLEQIALNYAKTPEGLKAKDMLRYLKSELQLELTDGEGKNISPTKPAAPTLDNVDERPAPQRVNAGPGLPGALDPNISQPVKNNLGAENEQFRKKAKE